MVVEDIATDRDVVGAVFEPVAGVGRVDDFEAFEGEVGGVGKSYGGIFAAATKVGVAAVNNWVGGGIRARTYDVDGGIGGAVFDIDMNIFVVEAGGDQDCITGRGEGDATRNGFDGGIIGTRVIV